MKIVKIVRRVLWVVGITVLAGVLTTLVIFILSARIPAEYKPTPLTVEEQVEQAHRFVSHIAEDFGNRCGAGRPFEWTITADQLNRYLASIDAIAELATGDPDQRPSEHLVAAGLSLPVVAMNDGVLTIMVKAARHNKILSVDLAFDFDGRGQLGMHLAGMRVGVMPVPRRVLEENVDTARRELVEQLAEAQEHGGARIGPLPVRRLAQLLGNVVGLLDGRRVRPEIPWKLGVEHRVLVDRIEIADGRLTLHCVPVNPARTAPTSRPGSGEAGTPR